MAVTDRPRPPQEVSLDPAERQAARRRAWDALAAARVARFPLPPHGRIPNFAGAERAAAQLATLEAYRRARVIKVNPDAPQRPVRAMALRDGKVLVLPTPRLRGPFRLLDPARVPRTALAEAATLAGAERYGIPVPPEDLPRVDLVITGCVLVGRDGGRLGKGEGYSDLEYALLRTLGHPPMPVATTVHPLQVVTSIARQPYDLAVDWIATPEGVIPTGGPHAQPDRILWELLDAEDLVAMPVLAALRGRGPRSAASGSAGAGGAQGTAW